MNLYGFFEVVLGLAIMALGLYMHFSPVNATKEEKRDNQELIEKTKRNGTILIILGGIVTVMMIISNFIL